VKAPKEDKAGWSAFLKHLKERGLNGVRLIISDTCMGFAVSAAEFFPDAAWQRCVVHWYRNIFSHVPSTNAEADRLCNAQRYERSEARRDTRAGHYERRLQTKAGEVRLKIPKLRQQTQQRVQCLLHAASNDTVEVVLNPLIVRDSNYRTLPAARELGRGSADRDVSGGRFGSAG
jgi:transposase-like protein